MHELFFPDGSCPSDSIVQQFLKIAESTDGAALLLPCLLVSAKTACNLEKIQICVLWQ